MFQRLHADNLWLVFYRTEMRLLPLLVGMERVGVQIDAGELKRIGVLLSAEAVKIEEQCQAAAGTRFNVSSSKQVREVLYNQLKLDVAAGVVVGKTAGGVKSTCEASLKKLEAVNAIPGLILKHRQLSKSQASYVQGLLKHHIRGRIHTTWDQIGAATGRLTSVEPNLQAIPKTSISLSSGSVSLRAAFVSTPGFCLVSADYEQIELRILAHLSGDPSLLRAIRTGGDIFRELTAVWQEKPVSSIEAAERDKTKHVVYALMYGAGKNRLSELLETSADKAQNIINSFYNKFSQIKSFNRSVVGRAEQQGSLVNMFGRKRYFPHINAANLGLKIQAQRQAFNFLIQGTAADIAKNAVITTQGRLEARGLEARVVLLVHDEIVWEVKTECREDTVEEIFLGLQDHSSIFPARVDFKVPLKVKISAGSNLGDVHRIERN